MLTPRDHSVLLFIATYDIVTRSMITRELFPGDDGRVTRKRLSVMRALELVNQAQMRMTNPSILGGIGAPVYFAGQKLPAFLAQEQQDDRYLLLNSATPSWMFLYHGVAVAETHLLLNKAVAQMAGARLVEWIGERTIADRTAADARSGRFRLIVYLSEKLICKPDAAFLLEVETEGFHRKVFFLEQDRDTTKNAERVAAQKSGGYTALVEKRMHIVRHFPTATVEKPTVLFVAPSPKRREALRKAFAKKPTNWLYRFAAIEDLTPATMLTSPIWHQCVGDPVPMIKTEALGAGPESGPGPARPQVLEV